MTVLPNNENALKLVKDVQFNMISRLQANPPKHLDEINSIKLDIQRLGEIKNLLQGNKKECLTQQLPLPLHF